MIDGVCVRMCVCVWLSLCVCAHAFMNDCLSWHYKKKSLLRFFCLFFFSSLFLWPSSTRPSKPANVECGCVDYADGPKNCTNLTSVFLDKHALKMRRPYIQANKNKLSSDLGVCIQSENYSRKRFVDSPVAVGNHEIKRHSSAAEPLSAH